MELHHEFVVPIGIEEAWEAFNDLERIGPAFPGAAVTGVDGDDFTGSAKVKLGPISLQYTGTGTFASRDATGKRAVIEASGKDKRGNGTAGATITASLHEEGTGTRVLLDTDLKITGRPAQFGRGVIQDVGGKILDQFAANLTTLLSPSQAPADVEAAPVDDSPVEETSAEVARSVRRHLHPCRTCCSCDGAGPRERTCAAGRDDGAGADRAGRARPRVRRGSGAAAALRGDDRRGGADGRDHLAGGPTGALTGSLRRRLSSASRRSTTGPTSSTTSTVPGPRLAPSAQPDTAPTTWTTE